MDIMNAKRLSEKYVSKSGVFFRLIEMSSGPFQGAFGISKARHTGTHLHVELTRAIDGSNEKNRVRVTALFNRFVRFYKDHWVEVV